MNAPGFSILYYTGLVEDENESAIYTRKRGHEPRIDSYMIVFADGRRVVDKDEEKRR